MEQTEVVALEALDVATEAKGLRVVDGPSYTQAGDLLLACKAVLGRIGDTFDPHIKRAHESHRALIASKQAVAAPLLEAEHWLKQGLSAYDEEQEQARREEEARRQALVRADAESRRLAEAAALELDAHAAGDAELLAEAQRILAAPRVAPTVILASTVPKVAGVSHRDQWTAEVVNVAALLAHVATHPEHLGLVQPNQMALNNLARALKGALQIPGVRAVRTPIVAARR